MRHKPLAFFVAPAHASGGVLTVDEAVDMALHSNANVLAAEARLRGDRDQQRSVGAMMLPSFHVFDEAQHWNDPFAIGFGGVSFTVRDQDTNTFAASVDQQLTGLLVLSHERSARASTADAAEAEYAALRTRIKTEVEVGFLHVFEARALEDIAKASEGELTEQVQVTKAKVDAGVLTNADFLRVQVAVADAQRREIAAHTQGQMARANLLGLIGLPNASGVELAEPKDLLARARTTLPRDDEAERTALARRPEVKQRELQLAAADHEASARKMALGPRIDAEAGYSNLQGQPFSPQNAAYVGLKLDWPIFEWGSSYYAQRAAREQAEAAKYQLQGERRLIGVQVANDLAVAQDAASAVDLAEQTIASAEEAYRVTEALLKAGTATTTDVLSAQAALTQARLNRVTAQYEQAIAQVSLDRTLGR